MAQRTKRRWSQQVTENSNALDLEPGVFKLGSPRAIAASLRRSAEASDRRKSSPFRSAMSMLVFYENRAGKNLSEATRKRLDAAKAELRKQFGRSAPDRSSRPSGPEKRRKSRTRGGARRPR